MFIAEAASGLLAHDPELTKDGSGGAYLIRSARGKKIAVFKPCDEEPGSSHNPRPKSEQGYVEPKLGFVPGESAAREVAAYVLDRANFADVPPTTIANLALTSGAAPQRGSLQKFVPHEKESWDIGPGVFIREEVHAIALLDLRLLNADRHGGNMLLSYSFSETTSNDVNEEEAEEGASPHLTPIDHGFCLPAFPFIGDSWFEWISWPQCHEPLSRAAKNYIANIDVEADVHDIISLGLPDECATTLRIGTMLVQKVHF